MGKTLVSIKVIEFIVNLYDIITLPLYYLIQQPWKVQQLAERVRARRLENNTWVNIDNKLDKSDKKQIDTLDQLFRDSVETNATRDCLGVRKVLGVELKPEKRSSAAAGDNKLPNGSNTYQQEPIRLSDNRVVKYDLDDKYSWYTYSEIANVVTRLSAGLINLCGDSLLNSDKSYKLLICADTCMQWFMIAHACFRNNVTVVTAYTTLDDEAILHIVQESEVKILVVSQKFAHRVPAIIKQSPHIDTIILLDDPLPGIVDERTYLKQLLGSSNVKRVISYDDLLVRGSETKENILAEPTTDDIAVLMYTSGSTGKAKGVMLSHKSIVYTALAFSGPGDITNEDRYIGYLPLGHVLELAAECIFLRNGSTIAYSSPMTLVNSSPMIKKGQYGDCYIFKPTIMGAVPLVLDRIRNAIQSAVKSKGPFFDQLINDFVVRYKRYWWERYYDTPIMNQLICRPFGMIFGGQMRAICSGGAALSRDTQEYLRYVTNYTVLQGYGLTETSAAASFCDIHDRRCNVVGPPYPIVRIKLESWCDYSVNDKPYPRGEIIIGGQPVSPGYYKHDDLTRESFYVENGIRYFRSGDIGMMLPDGCLKIIDRKKDIVKPLAGEYICLSEIESTLNSAPIVDNICVYCSQYSNHVVAIVRPDVVTLRSLAKQMFQENNEFAQKFRASMFSAYKTAQYEPNSTGSNLANGHTTVTKTDDEPEQATAKSGKFDTRVLDTVSDEALCNNSWVVDRVIEIIKEAGINNKLKRTQVPAKIKLVTDEWSPETGLITPSFKLRRRELERRYMLDIKQLYTEMGQNIDQ